MMKQCVPHRSSRSLLLGLMLGLLPLAAVQAQDYSSEPMRPEGSVGQPMTGEGGMTPTPAETTTPSPTETGPAYEAQVPHPRGARGPLRPETGAEINYADETELYRRTARESSGQAQTSYGARGPLRSGSSTDAATENLADENEIYRRIGRESSTR